MATLQGVLKGIQVAPRRLELYGIQGIGKSTFAAQAPSPIFIQTEEGANELDVDKLPLATSFEDVMQSIESLYVDPHEYKTVVLDSLDALESLIWQAVCVDKDVKTIDDIGWNKGYSFALRYWREILDGLNALRAARGMTVILIAHSRVERFDSPESESYERFVPKLHKLSGSMISEWADEVLFATYKAMTRKVGDTKRHIAVGTGERVLRTTERPAFSAKNRLGLPDELPLEWSAYASYFSKAK